MRKQRKKMTECSICYQKIVTDSITTVCNHTFHESCLNKWLHIKNECPYCRETYPKYDDPPPSLKLSDLGLNSWLSNHT